MARQRGTGRATSSELSATALQVTPVTLPTSSLATMLRFPSVLILSFVLSSSLYTLASPYTRGDLSTVSGTRDSWWEVAGLLSWRVVELGVGWWQGFDTQDLASLTFLTHLPYLFLLTSFYRIRPTTAASCILIDVATTCVPFKVFRASSTYHGIKTPKGTAANRAVIDDWGVQVFTSLLAAGVYGVVVFASFGTWMPTYLVTHFDGIKDISSLHDSKVIALMAAFIPTGIAAKTFLFTPSTAAMPDKHDRKVADFDPETASLGETVLYNVWGHSKRVRTLIQRTATLVALGGVHTWLHTFLAVNGAEAFGAAGWSSIWSIAAVSTSIVFWWVADVDSVSN